MDKLEAFQVIHYICPIAVFLGVILCRILGEAVIAPRKVNGQKCHRQFSTQKYLALGAALMYAVQGLIVIIQITTTRPVAYDEIVFVVSSIVVWIWIGTLDRLPWHGYVWPAFASVISNAMLLSLGRKRHFMSTFRIIDFVMQVSQAVLWTCMIAFAVRVRFRNLKSADDESEPLLPSTADSTANATEEETEDQMGFKYTWNQKLRDNLNLDSATWWEYVKAFKIFVPYLIPRNNLRLQLYLAAFVSCLVIQRALNLLIPRQLGIIIDQLSATTDESNSYGPFIALAIYMFLNHFPLSYARDLVRMPLNEFAYKNIQNAAFEHVMKLDAGFHESENTMQICMTIMQGHSVNDLLFLLVEQVLPSVVDLIVAFWYLGHIFELYVSYAIFVAAVCYMICKTKTSNWVLPLRKEYTKANRNEAQLMSDSLSSWHNVLYFNRFDYESSRFRTAVDTLKDAEKRLVLRRLVADGLTGFIVALSFGLVSSLVIFLIVQQQAPVGSFVTLVTYWSGLWSPIDRMGSAYRHINEYLLDAERLLWLLQIQPDIEDGPNAKDLVLTNANVTYKNVHFSYDSRKPTLQTVTFSASSGTTALVGETGAGKTTVFKLLHRLYDVSDGSIQIDGQDIRDITLNSLRNCIGIVPQSPYLFDTSIMHNVRYARLDATDEEVFDACKAATIHDKILTFPDGYDSIVGQRGVKLSGGELQRVAIARCLLKNPRILLLDEASSSVDSETEAQIQAALGKLTTGRTTFAIAHRLSTIVNADQILVFHEGRIVESGTHHELLQKSSRYHNLWSIQVASAVEGMNSRPVEDEPRLLPAESMRQQSSRNAIIEELGARHGELEELLPDSYEAHDSVAPEHSSLVDKKKTSMLEELEDVITREAQEQTISGNTQSIENSEELSRQQPANEPRKRSKSESNQNVDSASGNGSQIANGESTGEQGQTTKIPTARGRGAGRWNSWKGPRARGGRGGRGGRKKAYSETEHGNP